MICLSPQCCGILAFVFGIIILCGFMLLCGHFLGGRSIAYSKNVPFESGVESLGSVKVKFFIKFYLIAMVFVIFDVEGIYIYIWSISIRDVGWLGFIEMFVFVLVLLVGLLYLIRMDVFNWIKKPVTISKNNY